MNVLMLVVAIASLVKADVTEEVGFVATKNNNGGLDVNFDAHGAQFRLRTKRNELISARSAPVVIIGDDGKPRNHNPPPGARDVDDRDVFGSVDKSSLVVLKRSGGLLSGHVARNDDLYEITQTGDNTLAVVKKRKVAKSRNSGTFVDFQDISTRVVRERRNAGNIVAGIESLVMVDYTLWKKFYKKNNQDRTKTIAEIKHYFAYVIHGVDLLYQNIQDNNINIFLTLAGYVIAESPAGSPWYEKNKQSTSTGFEYIDVKPALEGLQSYMTKHRSELPKHDHAFSFSNLEFTDKGSKSVAGFAPMADICSASRSISITESHGGFGCIAIAAHELGHNLGADHDGDNGCKEANHIMDPDGGSSNLGNVFYFSSCSVNEFKKTLSDRQCVKDQATHGDPALWAKHMAKLPGQIYSADVQCQQMYGEDSGECGQWVYDKKGYNKCVALWCKTSGGGCETRYTFAATGTDCGKDMWCKNGKCVPKDSSITTTASTSATSKITSTDDVKTTDSASTSTSTTVTSKITTVFPASSISAQTTESASTSTNTTFTPMNATEFSTSSISQGTTGSDVCINMYQNIKYLNKLYTCQELASSFNFLCKRDDVSRWCCQSCKATISTSASPIATSNTPSISPQTTKSDVCINMYQNIKYLNKLYTCQELASSFNFLCKRDDVSRWCCQSCKATISTSASPIATSNTPSISPPTTKFGNWAKEKGSSSASPNATSNTTSISPQTTKSDACINMYQHIKYLNRLYTCQELASSFNFLCKRDDVSRWCCQSCKATISTSASPIATSNTPSISPRTTKSDVCINMYQHIKYLNRLYTCQELASSFNFLCKRDDVSRWCCQSCKTTTPPSTSAVTTAPPTTSANFPTTTSGGACINMYSHIYYSNYYYTCNDLVWFFNFLCKRADVGRWCCQSCKYA